jgi:starvation-inducible DNA-binding protein
MEDLAEELKVALASTFSFYLKAHNFHWNVEGIEFPQLHSFFETIYTDAWEAVDGIAEHIRTLDAYAPGSLVRFKQLSLIQDETNIPPAPSMLAKLKEDNEILIQELTRCQLLAEKNRKTGLANYLQDRIDRHEKHGWMLRATIKAAK